MTKALSHISVLDLSSSISGAYCTMLMADLGATVVKVEDRQTGDAMRCYGPEINGAYPAFTAYNRNKKSVAMDLDDSLERKRLREILTNYDVLATDLPEETMEKWGLNHEALKEEFPQLITLSISAFGGDDLFKNRPAFEETLQAESGLSFSIIDNSKGTPYNITYPIVEVSSGFYAIIGVLGALHQRRSTGRGQEVKVNKSLSGSFMLHFNILDNLFYGTVFPGHGGGAPIGFVNSKDGIVRINSDEDVMWKRTLNVIEDPLIHDPKFLDSRTREDHEDFLMERMEAWTKEHTNKEIEELFMDAGIPVGFVRSVEELSTDPHLKARGQIISLETPGCGKLLYFAAPFKLNDTQIAYERAPFLGEHNEEILGGI